MDKKHNVLSVARLIAIAYILISVMSILAAQSNSAGDKIKMSVYMDNMKLGTIAYANVNGTYDGHSDDIYVPLICTMQQLGAKTIKNKNGSISIFPDCTEDKKIVATWDAEKFKLSFYSDRADKPYRVDESTFFYKTIDGKKYVQLSRFIERFGIHQFSREGKSIYLYSEEFLRKGKIIGTCFGKKLEVDVYLDGEAVQAEVYEYVSEVGRGPRFRYIELEPLAKACNYRIKKISSSQYELSGHDISKVTIRPGRTTTVGNITYKADTFANVDGKLFATRDSIEAIFDGNSTNGDSEIFFISKSYIDPSIPTNLEECYAYLDKNLSKDEKNLIKSSKEEDLEDYHFGFGAKIRNSLIYPSYSMLDDYFAEKGISDADKMSAIIIRGYWLYLNGKKADFTNTEKRSDFRRIGEC